MDFWQGNGIGIVLLKFIFAVSIPILYRNGLILIAIIKLFSLEVSIARGGSSFFLHTYANKASGVLLFTIPLAYRTIGTSMGYMALLFLVAFYAAMEEFLLFFIGHADNPDQKSCFSRKD